MSDSNCFLPDPGFQRRQKHVIDVLVPPCFDEISKAGFKNEHFREIDSVNGQTLLVSETDIKRNGGASAKEDPDPYDEKSTTLRCPAVITPGYNIDQYDLERLIAIESHENLSSTHRVMRAQGDDLAESHPENNVGKNKKRKRFPDENNFDFPTGMKHKLSWNVFRKYLEHCIPVKIQQVSLFRDLSNRNSTNHISSLGSLECVLPCDVEDFPPLLLDMDVTVQCAFPAENTEPSPAQRLDDAISFSTSVRDSDSIPTFMGQEDQITTEMRLREAVTWQQMKNSQHEGEGKHNQSRKSCMAVCLAQLPILALSEDEDEEVTSARYDPYSCRTNCDQNRMCSNSTKIAVKSNGQVYKFFPPRYDAKSASSSTTNCDESPVMATLASMLRLPSYLLMEDPSEFDECRTGCEYTKSQCIEIHDINLWHAPQNCRTNVHYDDRDNLLMVTRGVKTVELCPPGCIRGSGVYSEHANHPYLLRKRIYNLSSTKQINLEVEKTRQLKKDRTLIVSVCEGEALYIPRGWWHRVESASSLHDKQPGRGCTAVNVWFDYRHSSRSIDSCSPTHMRSFQLRQSARHYYSIHKGDVIVAILEEKRKAICRNKMHDEIFESMNSIWKKLNDVVLRIDCWEVMKMRQCSKLLAKCWEKIVGANHEFIEKVKEEDMMEAFRIAMEMFLYRIDLADAGHLKELVRFWHLFRVHSDRQESSTLARFAMLIMGLSRESCFVITQAWDSYGFVTMKSFGKSASNCAKECNFNVLLSEAKASYQHFFAMVGENEEERIRLFFFENVESFQHEICQSLFSSLISC